MPHPVRRGKTPLCGLVLSGVSWTRTRQTVVFCFINAHGADVTHANICFFFAENQWCIFKGRLTLHILSLAQVDLHMDLLLSRTERERVVCKNAIECKFGAFDLCTRYKCRG